MRHINNFNEFIFEKLGIVSSLYEIANIILDKLKDNKYFLLETEYKGLDIKVHCYLDKNINQVGLLRVNSPNMNIFTIKINDLSKATLIHELKHLDRYVSRDYKSDYYHYLNHIGRYVMDKFKYITKEPDILISTLYMVNPEEFEAYFNGFNEELKDILKDSMSNDEKRKVIDNFLNNEPIYQLYKFYNLNGFDLSKFFKTNRDLNLYLKDLIRNLKLFKEGGKVYRIGGLYDLIKLGFGKFINKFRDDIKDGSIDPSLYTINSYITKEARRNFKKFSRLYTINIS